VEAVNQCQEMNPSSRRWRNIRAKPTEIVISTRSEPRAPRIIRSTSSSASTSPDDRLLPVPLQLFSMAGMLISFFSAILVVYLAIRA